MKEIIFVTGNDLKFETDQKVLETYEVNLDRNEFDDLETQGITRDFSTLKIAI